MVASLSIGSCARSNIVHHLVKGATRAVMTPEGILNVKSRRLKAVSHVAHFAGRHKQEHSMWIDKALDQPRAGNAINLGASTCDPDG